MGSPAGTAPDISVAWPLLTVAGAGVMLLVTALVAVHTELLHTAERRQC